MQNYQNAMCHVLCMQLMNYNPGAPTQSKNQVLLFSGTTWGLGTSGAHMSASAKHTKTKFSTLQEFFHLVASHNNNAKIQGTASTVLAWV